MLCEHCGKNEAIFHRVNIVNGEAEETHLCAECASELRRRGTLPESGIITLILTLLSDELPSIRRRAAAAANIKPLLDEQKTQTLRLERKRNALKWQLEEAVRQERYEEAAIFRDQLAELENAASDHEGSAQFPEGEGNENE